MIMYAIFYEDLQGSSYYRSYEEALNAAKFRSYCTGVEWTVREVLIKRRDQC